MSDMTTVEAKAFVPARDAFVPGRDFALSKQFYQDLGFVADAAHCWRFATELSGPARD